MLTKHQFWILTVAGILAVALAVVNMYLFQDSRTLQQRAGSRAQYIQQSMAMQTLYRQIVQELADRAVRTRDDQVRDMLAAEGLAVSFEQKPAEAETPGARK